LSSETLCGGGSGPSKAALGSYAEKIKSRGKEQFSFHAARADSHRDTEKFLDLLSGEAGREELAKTEGSWIKRNMRILTLTS
jgi:hypothetical protein